MSNATSTRLRKQSAGTISAPDSVALSTTEATVRDNNDYPVHPAANIFPMMSEEDFPAFKEDIRTRGQLEDVVLFDGLVLDGRNRYRACKELGIEVQFCELTEYDDPIAYVVSKNLQRRHLSQSQRAQCAADVAKMRLGDNQHNKGEGQQFCLPSIDDAAKAFSVSPRSVITAKHVSEKGDAAVVEAVKAGTISVSAAAKLVDAVPDKKEQRRILKEGRKAVVDATRANAKTVIATAPLDAIAGHASRLLDTATDYNAVAFIRSALGDGLCHSHKSLFSDLSKPERSMHSFINEIKSESEQSKRYALAKAAEGSGEDSRFSDYVRQGEQIIRTTLAAMVWLGIVIQDGEGDHASYRLVAASDVVDVVPQATSGAQHVGRAAEIGVTLNSVRKHQPRLAASIERGVDEAVAEMEASPATPTPMVISLASQRAKETRNRPKPPKRRRGKVSEEACAEPAESDGAVITATIPVPRKIEIRGEAGTMTVVSGGAGDGITGNSTENISGCGEEIVHSNSRQIIPGDSRQIIPADSRQIIPADSRQIIPAAAAAVAQEVQR